MNKVDFSVLVLSRGTKPSAHCLKAWRREFLRPRLPMHVVSIVHVPTARQVWVSRWRCHRLALDDNHLALFPCPIRRERHLVRHPDDVPCLSQFRSGNDGRGWYIRSSRLRELRGWNRFAFPKRFLFHHLKNTQDFLREVLNNIEISPQLVFLPYLKAGGWVTSEKLK